MDIHEYQAKDLLRRAGVPVQPGEVADTPSGVEAIATRYGTMVVVKAQVHAGGRGKAGGVKLAKTPAEARAHAERILGMSIKGLVVTRVLVAQAADIASESYVGIIVDRVFDTEEIVVKPVAPIQFDSLDRLPERPPDDARAANDDPIGGMIGNLDPPEAVTGTIPAPAATPPDQPSGAPSPSSGALNQ